jgi:hypothetical protein
MVGVKLPAAEPFAQAVPVRSDEFNFQTFLLVKAQHVGREDRGLSGQAEISNLELSCRVPGVILPFVASGYEEQSQATAGHYSQIGDKSNQPKNRSLIHAFAPMHQGLGELAST